MTMSDAQRQYSERLGAYWESVGFSRAGGSIIGFLTVCEPAHQSQAQIAAALHLSSGSVSTQVRHLEGVGLLERVRFPGERTQHYQMPEGAWWRVMESETGRINAIGTLADAGAAVLPAHRPDRITDMGAMARFFAAEWPALLARMQEYQRTERL